MAWFLPVLAVGTAASLLFSVSKARAAAASASIVPTIPQAAQAGQRRPPASALPAGTPLAVVDPFCVPDAPPCNVGMRLRTGPGTSFPTVGEDGDPRHAFTGDLVGVLEQKIAEANRPAGSKAEWWHIVTAGGGDGFARAIDPEGNPNFAFTGEKAGQPGTVAISGYGGACCVGCAEAALPVVVSGPGGMTASSLLSNVASVCAAVDRAAANGTLPATFARLREVLGAAGVSNNVEPRAIAYLSRLCGMLEGAATQNNLPAALGALQTQYLAALQAERGGMAPLQGGGTDGSGVAYAGPLTQVAGARVGLKRLQGFRPPPGSARPAAPGGGSTSLLGVLIAQGIARGLSPAQATTEALGELGRRAAQQAQLQRSA